MENSITNIEIEKKVSVTLKDMRRAEITIVNLYGINGLNIYRDVVNDTFNATALYKALHKDDDKKYIEPLEWIVTPLGRQEVFNNAGLIEGTDGIFIRDIRVARKLEDDMIYTMTYDDNPIELSGMPIKWPVHANKTFGLTSVHMSPHLFSVYMESIDKILSYRKDGILDNLKTML